MAVRRHPMSLLLVLPDELTIEIADHLAGTSEWPMDDLCSLRVTCSSMRRICSNPTVGRRVALHQCRHGLGWDEDGNYYALLSSLTQLGNPEACFLTRIAMVFEETHRPQPCLNDLTRAADGGHNLVTYMVAILLYRHNDDARDDDTASWYMRRVEGEEESRAAVAGDGGEPTSRWLCNKGCVLCHREVAGEVIRESGWTKGKLSLPSPAQVRGDLSCTGDACGDADGWEGRAVYCSEDYRLHREFKLAWELGIRD